MAFFKRNTNSQKVKKQLGSLFREIGMETMREVGEVGKEIARNVTMLPVELVAAAVGSNSVSESNGGGSGQKDQKSWADEWLKDQNSDKNKPPISQTTGAHTGLNTAEMFGKSDEEQKKAVLRRIENAQHSKFEKASATSEYGQQLAKEQQEKDKQEKIYDTLWQEREEEKQKNEQQLPQLGLPTISSKRARGDWRGGKKKKATMPMKTMENKAGMGKK
jgi:hypothetical protein